MKKIKFNNLVTKVLGSEIFYYKKIDSTQKEIWRRIVTEKIKNGTIIIADVQTQAIGTHGRTWHTSQKGSIAFSLCLFPDCKLENLKTITKDIAKLLVDIFYDFYNVKIDIKNPNDLIINNKKIGGILTETRLNGENIKDLVIGIGINTNKKDFEDDIKDIATSVYNQYKIKVDNIRIITEFCNRFEKYLEREKIK